MGFLFKSFVSENMEKRESLINPLTNYSLPVHSEYILNLIYPLLKYIICFKNGEERNILPEFRTSAGQTFKYSFR